jgi:hypothetical protein
MSDQIGGDAPLPEQQDPELQQLQGGAAQQHDHQQDAADGVYEAADANDIAQDDEDLEDEDDAEFQGPDFMEQLLQDAMDEDLDEVDEADADGMWHEEDIALQVI